MSVHLLSRAAQRFACMCTHGLPHAWRHVQARQILVPPLAAHARIAIRGLGARRCSWRSPDHDDVPFRVALAREHGLPDVTRGDRCACSEAQRTNREHADSTWPRGLATSAGGEPSNGSRRAQARSAFNLHRRFTAAINFASIRMHADLCASRGACWFVKWHCERGEARFCVLCT